MSELLVITTFPDMSAARQIGTELVSRQLIACVNLLPSAESIYLWEGETKQESEVIGLMKTTRQAYEALQSKLVEIHPYDVPEIIAVPVETGLPEYLDWVRGQVGIK